MADPNKPKKPSTLGTSGSSKKKEDTVTNTLPSANNNTKAFINFNFFEARKGTNPISAGTFSEVKPERASQGTPLVERESDKPESGSISSQDLLTNELLSSQSGDTQNKDKKEESYQFENLLYSACRVQMKLAFSETKVRDAFDSTFSLERKKKELLDTKKLLEQKTRQLLAQTHEHKNLQKLIDDLFSQMNTCDEHIRTYAKSLETNGETTPQQEVANNFYSVICQMEIMTCLYTTLVAEKDKIQKQNEELEKEIEQLSKRLTEIEEEKKLSPIPELMNHLGSLISIFEKMNEDFESSPNVDQNTLRLLEETTANVEQMLLYDQQEDCQLFNLQPNMNTNDDDSPYVLYSKKDGEKQIKAATVNKLVEHLTHPNRSDTQFAKTFLLVYRSFITPHDLLEKLVYRFFITPHLVPEASLMELRTNMQRPIQIRVLSVIRHWVELHFPDFDEELSKKLNFFLAMLNSINLKIAMPLQGALNKKITGESSKRIRHSTPLPDPILPVTFDPLGFTLDEIDAVELSRQITLIQHSLYLALQPKEFLNQGWNKKDKEKRSPNVLAMIKMFNQISGLVCMEIVSVSDLNARRNTLVKFIKVANECYKMNNFDGVMAVISGLENSSVFRLKKTWEGITKEVSDQYADMKSLMENNFKLFREKLATLSPPCVPYIGIFLTDLTFTEDGNKDFVSGNLVNFNKLRQVAEKIQQVLQYQNDIYHLQHVSCIQEKISSTTISHPDALYKRSCEIEPSVKK